MGYKINRTVSPPICLPTSVDESQLVNITQAGDPWQVFEDPKTGARHDGTIYYRRVNTGRLAR